MVRSSKLGIYSLQDGMDIMQDSAGDSASFLHSIPLLCKLYGQSRYSIVIVFGCSNPQSCDATRPSCGVWTGDASGGTPTGTPPGSLSPPYAPRAPPTSALRPRGRRGGDLTARQRDQITISR